MLRFTILLSTCALFAACGADSTTEPGPDPEQSGVFLDSPVANLGYRIGEGENQFTDNAGGFTYRSGDVITFFLGSHVFPTVGAQDVLSPLSLARARSIHDPVVVNMIRLLQTLDQDLDASNGITVSASAHANATPMDFSLSVDDFASAPAVTELIANAGHSVAPEGLVPAASAAEHFAQSLSASLQAHAVNSGATPGLLVDGELGRSRFPVEAGRTYTLTLTPASEGDDPDLLVFRSFEQMENYWDIADANGGEQSPEAIAARVAKSSKGPGVVDDVEVIDEADGDYWIMVTGPDDRSTRYTLAITAEADDPDECDGDCSVDPAVDNPWVTDFTPTHLAQGVPTTAAITLSLETDFPIALNDLGIELFQVASGRNDCRIDLGGFRCGNLGAEDSFALVEGGFAIFGEVDSIDGRTVTFSFESPLVANRNYIVHVFSLSESMFFKTWWGFGT